MLIVTAALIASGSPRLAMAQSSASKEEAEDFELVKRIGTRGAWEIFLRTYPNGPYTGRAQEALSKLPNVEGMTRPNWGDDKFIKRHIDRQRQ